jgi:hypothetical protein
LQPCLACNKREHADLMLLCDGCGVGQHTFCCDPPFKEIPEDEWFCAACEVRHGDAI